MNFSFKIRYHTDQVENLKFRKLDSNGYLYESNDINEINISDNKNINYYNSGLEKWRPKRGTVSDFWALIWRKGRQWMH